MLKEEFRRSIEENSAGTIASLSALPVRARLQNVSRMLTCNSRFGLLFTDWALLFAVVI